LMKSSIASVKPGRRARRAYLSLRLIAQVFRIFYQTRTKKEPHEAALKVKQGGVKQVDRRAT
jgi:hypothetical protein